MENYRVRPEPNQFLRIIEEKGVAVKGVSVVRWIDYWVVTWCEFLFGSLRGCGFLVWAEALAGLFSRVGLWVALLFHPEVKPGCLNPIIAIGPLQCWQINVAFCFSWSGGISTRKTHCTGLNVRFALPCKNPKSRARLNPSGNVCCNISAANTSPFMGRVFIVPVLLSLYWKVTFFPSSLMMLLLLMTPRYR